MRIIFGTAAGFLAGYITSVLAAPRSGEQTRKQINLRLARPVKDSRMLINKFGYKTGLISEKKKAELNKKTVEAYNTKINQGRQSAGDPIPDNQQALEKAHERAGATKAVTSSTDKSNLRKVPTRAQ